MRIDHLFGRVRGHFKTQEIEDNHGYHRNESRIGPGEVAGVHGLQTVLVRIDDHRRDEQPQQGDTCGGAHQKDPSPKPDTGADHTRRTPYEDGGGHPFPQTRQREEELFKGDHRDDAERATDPHRIGDPVEELIDTCGELAERKLGPHIGAALLRESRPQFRGEQPVRQEEDDCDQRHPQEPLRPIGADRAQGVDTHQRTDQYREDVHATKGRI
ncbi:Uncharacterised protein [Mycobacteroides abscessus subsp. abscessus]|nr:Uncharacterised protein [Mycobacteroides abscessus subsp. abscessus]